MPDGMRITRHTFHWLILALLGVVFLTHLRHPAGAHEGVRCGPGAVWRYSGAGAAEPDLTCAP
jgi:hypothetical protein